MRKLPPLNALRAFEVAARHMSFADAAVELGVTATAVSHQIRLLEETIGQPLFQRFPRPMVLTEAGQRLFPAVRNALDDMARVVGEIGHEPRKAVVRISTTAALAGRVLLPELSDWSRRFPDTELDIHASDYIVDLRSGDCDLALRYARTTPGDLAGEPLADDAYIPMANPMLLGERVPEQLTSDDILALPLIANRWKTPDPAEPSWEAWRTMAARSSDELRCLSTVEFVRISEESHAIDAAAAGHGVVLASRVITRDLRQAGKLVALSNVSLPGLTYFAIRSPITQSQKSVDHLEAWLAEILARDHDPGPNTAP